MSPIDHTHGAIWGIAALATSGVIIRPGHLPEAVCAVLGMVVMPPAFLLALGGLVLLG